jgi:hypothetical protein
MKLPTSADLGQTPRVEGARPVARIDASPVAAGVEQMGQGLAKLGLAGIPHESRYQFAKASSALLTRKAALGRQAADDPNFADLPRRYGASLDDARTQATAMIGDPALQGVFSDATLPLLGHANLAALDLAERKRSAFMLADGRRELGALRDAGVETNDEPTEARIIDTGNGIVDTLAAAGHLDPADAAPTKREWLQDYATARLTAMPAEARLAALRAASSRDDEAGSNPAADLLAGTVGADAAQKIRSADPATPVVDVLGQDGVDRNPAALYGRTAGEVAAEAQRRSDAMARSGPSFAAFLAPDQRESLLREAQSEVLREEQAKKSTAQFDAARLRAALTDDVASVLRNGQGTDVDAGKVRLALGSDAYARWHTARGEAYDTFAASHDLPSLTSGQIADRLASLEPHDSSDASGRERRIYAAVKQQADDLIARRKVDPAATFEADPVIEGLRARADPNDQAAFRELAAARLALEEKAGIPPAERSPITRAEALQLTDTLQHVLPGQEAAALTGLADKFRQMFGPAAEPALAFALHTRLETLPPITAATAEASAGGAPAPANAPPPPTRQTQPPPSASAGSGGTLRRIPPPSAIRALREHPERSDEFDRKYGDGLSGRILQAYPLPQPSK